MKKLLGFVLIALVAITSSQFALGQSADWKITGVDRYKARAAGRLMRSAREYSQDYREYVRTAPAKKVSPEVAKDAADTIGEYISKSQKHMASMRKNAGGDKETLASLDSIDKNLASAAKHHKEMHECCMEDDVDADRSVMCCEHMDESLKLAIAEHDKLMKRLADEKPAAPGKSKK